MKKITQYTRIMNFPQKVVVVVTVVSYDIFKKTYKRYTYYLGTVSTW